MMLADFVSVLLQSFVPVYTRNSNTGDRETTDRALDLAMQKLETDYGSIRIVKRSELWKLLFSLTHGYLVVKFVFPSDAPSQMLVEKISKADAIKLMVK